jgi:hypothetical protein
MLKVCVVHEGRVINFGPWDYQIRAVQVGEEDYEIEPTKDVDGETIPAVMGKRPIYEERETNPLPDGAEIVEMDVIYDEDHGWRVSGTPIPETPAQKTERLDQENALLALELVETQITLEQTQSEQAALLLTLVEAEVI